MGLICDDMQKQFGRPIHAFNGSKARLSASPETVTGRHVMIR